MYRRSMCLKVELKKAVETAVDDKIMNVHGLQKWFAIKSQRTTNNKYNMSSMCILRVRDEWL